MPRRDVIVPARILLENGLFMWPALKVDSLDYTIKNISKVYKSSFKGPISRDDKASIKEQVKLEIIITVLHYAEILASYLLAFKDGRRAIQRSLFSYRVADVDSFYKEIKTKRLSHIMRLFSYPQPYQLKSTVISKRVLKSSNKIKKELITIGNYYIEHRDLYNSYKHGLRVGILATEGPRPNISQRVITYFVPDRAYYPATAVVTRLDYKKACKLAYKIAALLHNATNQYLERVIDEKAKFSLRLY